MGLFGGKKIYVASSCWNLAGDEQLRPDYLKTMVVSGVISSSPRASIGQAIQDGYMSGPGIKLRGYHRWAQDNYVSTIGMSATGLYGAPDIDPAVVAANIPGGGATVSVQMVRSDPADFEVWAEQWMLENHPGSFTGSWDADFDDATGEIVVTLPSLVEHRFTPANFQKNALYIYASYNLVEDAATGDLVTGDLVVLAPGDSFPSTAGWTSVGGGVFTKTDYLGHDGAGRVRSLTSTMHQFDVSPTDRSYRIDTQEVLIREWSTPKVFIYRVGSGVAALDAEVTTSAISGAFMAPIPVRVDNAFLSESFEPAQYAEAKRAYRRLTGGGKFDELVEKLEDNPDLADIDYVFVVPGVSLNVRENACRKYLYTFFEAAMATSLYDEADHTAWQAGAEASQESLDDWEVWLAAQGSIGNPLNGAPEPSFSPLLPGARNEVRVKTSTTLGYDTRIAWKAITEQFGSGLGKPGALPGDIWLAKGDLSTTTDRTYGGALGFLSSVSKKTEDIFIYWQTDADSWKRLVIRGLVHQNYIYKGKYVEIGAHEALDDLDESGFIVPIHYETWRTMSLKDTTQMATACIFIVVNSYKVKKQKWYQTGFFKLVLFIVAVIVTIVFAPGGIGLLGTNAAVGATVGLVGVAAVIVGAIANTLAAMILIKLIGIGATELLGDQIGSIVAAIASFLTFQFVVGIQGGLSLAQSLSNLTNPMTLLNFTSSVGNGVAGYVQGQAQGILADAQDVMKRYEQQKRELEELYAQNIGYDRGLIDPLSLVDIDQGPLETREIFLGRTLMTGSDIAELTHSLLSNFATLTLSTDLPG